MWPRIRNNARRHPSLLGFVLIFLFTWPIDLAMAAQSQAWLPFHVPALLAFLVGYGFVVAAILATVLF